MASIGNGKWTPEEDAKLTAAVELHGAENWKQIAEIVGSRSHGGLSSFQYDLKLLSP